MSGVRGDLEVTEALPRAPRVLDRLTIDTVINAAGTGRTEYFSTSDAAALHQQRALNIGAVVNVSHASLPHLRSSGRGALVNIASLTGYMPVPGLAVYAGSASADRHHLGNAAQRHRVSLFNSPWRREALKIC